MGFKLFKIGFFLELVKNQTFQTSRNVFELHDVYSFLCSIFLSVTDFQSIRMHKPLLLYDYHEVLVFLSKLVHIVFIGTTACIQRIQNQCGGSLAGLEKLNVSSTPKMYRIKKKFHRAQEKL